MTQVTFAVLPVLISLIFAGVLVISVGKNPIDVLTTIWQGAFRNSKSFANVINFAIPLTLTCIGLIVTFRAGLWNIGIEGQILAGALFASWAALFLPLPDALSPLLILIELCLAMLGGIIWASLVGVLKVWLGVNEIFGGMALNSIASVWAIYLVSGPWYPEGGSAQSSAPFAQPALLPGISEDWPVSLLMLLITAAAIVAVPVLLNRTRWGLQLKATGKNPRSALMLGVPTSRVAMSAFITCGAMAGLAGAYRALFTYDSFRPLASGGIGFLGLLVVLLASMRIVWVVLITFAFSAILAGSTRLRVSMQLDSSLAGVLQGTLVLMFLLFNGWRQRAAERASASVTPEQQVQSEEPVEPASEAVTP